MKEMLKNNGITLIVLVITIIILLILAGISISLLKENELVNKSKQSKEEFNKSSAKEKLEMVLVNLQIDKLNEKNYNENEYIDNYFRKNNIEIKGNIVIVDTWKFEIDRSLLEIKNIIGKEDELDKFYLYKNGNEYISKTGGWESDRTSITKNDYYITLNTNGTASSLVTKKYLNIEDYDTIRFTYRGGDSFGIDVHLFSEKDNIIEHFETSAQWKEVTVKIPEEFKNKQYKIGIGSYNQFDICEIILE